MIDVNLEPRGKMRVWIGELPACGYPVAQTLSCELEPGSLRKQACPSAAVELLRYGGTNPYGLLGATFTASDIGSLRVAVGVSEVPGDRREDALTGKYDPAEVGLPLEYAGWLLRGAEDACRHFGLGPGTLKFNCAAHGHVGSSQYIFRLLAEMVVQIIACESESTSPERLREMVDQLFVTARNWSN